MLEERGLEGLWWLMKEPGPRLGREREIRGQRSMAWLGVWREGRKAETQMDIPVWDDGG